MVGASKMRSVVCAAILAVFTVPFSVSAATIYINSSTGNDSTGDGSSGSPYASFHKGYTVASTGDTLNLTVTFSWSDAAETGDSAISASLPQTVTWERGRELFCALAASVC